MKKNYITVKVGYFKYILDKEGKVCWCVDVSDRRKIYGVLKIPENITYQEELYKVIGIEEYGFYKTKVKSLILPESIESIGVRCCAESYYLEKIVIPESCKTIEVSSFFRCVNLEKIIFKGNPENIDIGMFAFGETKFIKKIKERLDGLNNNEGGYIGRNLIAISCNTEELYIKPNTEHVYITRLDGYLLDLKHIYFPKNLREIEFDISGISDRRKNEISAHFENIDDLLNCNFNKTLIFFSDLYIGNKKINCLNLPKGASCIDLNILAYFCKIQDLNLNLDLKYIRGNCFSSKCTKYMNQLYLPGNLSSLSYNSFYSVSVKHFSSRYSTLDRLSSYINHSGIKIGTLTIYIDEIRDDMFNTLLFKCTNVRLIPIKKFSSDELYKILYELVSYTLNFSGNLILDEDFLKINTELPKIYIKDKIGVYEAYLDDFKSHEFWGKCTNLIGIQDNNSYIVDETTNTCEICPNLNKYEDNDYVGIVKIPRKTKIHNNYYNVTGISSFAFTECNYLEEVIMDNTLNINDLAFENSYEDIKITKI